MKLRVQFQEYILFSIFHIMNIAIKKRKKQPSHTFQVPQDKRLKGILVLFLDIVPDKNLIIGMGFTIGEPRLLLTYSSFHYYPQYDVLGCGRSQRCVTLCKNLDINKFVSMFQVLSEINVSSRRRRRGISVFKKCIAFSKAVIPGPLGSAFTASRIKAACLSIASYIVFFRKGPSKNSRHAVW
jgi:hypothetical protein